MSKNRSKIHPVLTVDVYMRTNITSIDNHQVQVQRDKLKSWIVISSYSPLPGQNVDSDSSLWNYQHAPAGHLSCMQRQRNYLQILFISHDAIFTDEKMNPYMYKLYTELFHNIICNYESVYGSIIAIISLNGFDYVWKLFH